MTREEILAALDEVGAAVTENFGLSGRRDQFEAHLATVRMTVEHLFDEADRTE